jgi:hypothetical protein
MGALPQARLVSPPLPARNAASPPAGFRRPSPSPSGDDLDRTSQGSESSEDNIPAPRGWETHVDDVPTSQLPSEENQTAARTSDPEEAHIREVFMEYVAVRRQCGEPTSSLTLDKFRTKLETNRQQLIAKYNCKTARFSVYVKDGKAAIKATPVRE